MKYSFFMIFIPLFFLHREFMRKIWVLIENFVTQQLLWELVCGECGVGGK
jgi:hypothetical protein